jgi:hypothetical protein
MRAVTMIMVAVAACMAQRSFAQGQVSMVTIGSGAFLKFSNTVAGTWAYAGVVAGLYWGEDAGSVTNLVTPLAGLAGPVDVPSHPATWGAVLPVTGGSSRYIGRVGLDTYFQIRVWSDGYSSWEDASASGSPDVLSSSLAQAPSVVARTQVGSSAPIPQIPWGGTVDNPIVVDVFPVPEPATDTLLAMAGTALFWRLRRHLPQVFR